MGRLIILLMALSFIFHPVLLLAEDYPAEYLGAGFREYLSDKIQNGYYVEVFTKMDMRQKERVDKRNQVEGILNYSYQATPESTNGILAAENQHKDNADKLNTEIKQQRQQREQVATAQTEFNYIKYSDGKVAYFKDSLTTRVENERVVDELGNASIKNTYNMQYNDKRLLTSYEATSKDNLGNASHLYWYGVSYTPDSVFYGNKDTRASKNISDYYLKEIDSAGNTKLTHWQASNYEGKFLRAFSQTIEDSIYGKATFNRSNIIYSGNNPEKSTSYHEEGTGTDGLVYASDRTNLTYNDKEQVTGYHEEIFTTQLDGLKTKTTVDAKLKYLCVNNQFGPDVEEELNPDRLLEAFITTTTENPDGSKRTETATTTYNYDATKQLMAASEQSEFSGQEAQWYEYTDIQGHILSMNKDENGNTAYSYIDPDTLEVVAVPVDVVITTLKDGNKYTGSSETKYEALFGKPMAKEVNSHILYYGQNISSDELLRVEDSTLTYTNGLANNLQRVLGSQESTKVTRPLQDPENQYAENKGISTTYIYDAKGNLIDAQGEGKGNGWEYGERGWWGKYNSTINTEYEVILGKALRIFYEEDKDYE